MTLILPPSSMTTSILLRSPSSSPSPASTPLPALQTDISSNSSSSASGSCLDLHRTSSAPSTRRIRFAPLPDPRRDLLFEPLDSFDEPQSDTKSATHALPTPTDLPDGFVDLTPSISPDSTLSSARSTPTIRISAPSNSQKSNLKLFRPFAFLRASHSQSSSPSQSPPSQSTTLPPSRNLSRSSSSLPTSPSFQSTKLPRFSAEDILTLGTRSLFRARSESGTSTRHPRTSSPPPKSSLASRSLHRSASTSSGSAITLATGKREGPTSSHSTTSIAGSTQKKRRASSSALTPGSGGGRHTCPTKDYPLRPSTAPNSPVAAPKKHVKMLNGRVYGARRYAAQTLANPFANVRDDPEFVEWGYGGMGSVHASAGIANDVWKGLQRSERGGASLAGPLTSPTESDRTTAGGGRGGGVSATSPMGRRKMSENVPECSMGNVSAGGGVDEDDGSGMTWVKRRRAEREAKARLEQEARKRPQEGRKSGDSMDASMYASTASTTTSLIACTSAASTDMTTPATSPLVSRSPSLTDLNLTSSSVDPPYTATAEHPQKSDVPAHPTSTSKDEHEHHILTAVRLSPTHGRSPSLSNTLSHIGKDSDNGSLELAPLSPVDTEETTTSANSIGEDYEERGRASEDEDDVDDDEDEVQDVKRKTALGAGVEKISRHVDAESR